MVRLTDRLNMSLAVDWDVKPQTNQTNNVNWMGKEVRLFYDSNSIFQVKKKGTAVAKQKAEENDYFQQMEKVVFLCTLCQDRVQAGP